MGQPTETDDDEPGTSATLDRVLEIAVGAIGGQTREGQQQMAAAVEHALLSGEHLLVQAGTGTGKSLAYLVPALLHHETVVVATATIALQTQLVDRDLPALVDAIAPALGRRPTFAVLKGRSNYLCLSRVMDGPSDPAGAGGSEAMFAVDELVEPGAAARTIDESSASPMGQQVRALRAWADETQTGDRLELLTPVDDRVWRAFSVSGRECMGQSCPQVQDCFAELAREKAREADIVVTNHSLLAIGALENVPVLPEHSAVVVDEAHELIDRATSAATRELSVSMVERAAQRSRRPAGRDSADLLVEAAGALADALLTREAGRIERPDGSLFTAITLVRDSARAVLSAMGPATSGPGDSSPDAGARQVAKADLDELFETAGDLLALDERTVAWLEVDERRGRRLLMAPLSVARLLRQSLFANSTVVLTSATLQLGGGFDALAASVGLVTSGPGAESEKADAKPMRWTSLDVGSPFDYARQGICYVAAHLPARTGRQGSDGLPPEFLDEVVELIGAAGGRTLGLFSSKWAAQLAADAVRSRVGVPLITQWDAPLPQLIDQFTAEPRTCLFGTLSLWQGVDVPGAACTLVIIDKIPFPRPDDPLVAARQRAVDDAGRSGFMAVSVPRAALLLAQGAGRLIRSTGDKGVVAILDPRLRTARYGAYLMRTMPDFWTTTDPEVVRASLRALDDVATIDEAARSAPA